MLRLWWRREAALAQAAIGLSSNLLKRSIGLSSFVRKSVATCIRLGCLIAAAASMALSQGLSEADLLQMFRAGASDEEIARRLQRDGIAFEVNASVLLRLGEAGVPRDVLDAAMDARLSVAANPDDLIRSGKLDLAIRALSEVLQRNPREHQARYKLILVYMKVNRPVDAAAQFNILKGMQDDQPAREMVRQIEVLLPETGADPEKELALRRELRTAIGQLRTTDAYAVVDRMQIGKRSREVIKTYLDIAQANFPGALMRSATISSGGDTDDRRISEELRTAIERSFRQYQDLTRDLDRFLYSQLAVGSCTPTTARAAVGEINFSLQDYVQRVIDGNRMFPLDPRMQDLRFHSVLISSPRFEDVERVGEETLASKGSLRIPFFSRDELFWLVLDRRQGRIYTEGNSRMPHNSFGSPDLSALEPFNFRFEEVKGVRQREVADHALYGLARDSYVLALLPKGKAPNYTFMNLIHCLYGEQVQKTLSRNLGEMVLHVIKNPSMENALVDPGKKSRDWIMTGAQELAIGSMIIAVGVPVAVAVHPPHSSDGTSNSSNTQNTLNTANMSVSMIQTSLNILMAHAVELVRASEILGTAQEDLSMFGLLQNRVFPLVDPALSNQQIARLDNLLSVAIR